MADIPVRQVTIYLSIQTRAKVPTIKGWLEGGLLSELEKLNWAEGEGCKLHVVWVGDVTSKGNRRKYFDQLAQTTDHVLAELEGLVDEALLELEGCYDAIEEFNEGV